MYFFSTKIEVWNVRKTWQSVFEIFFHTTDIKNSQEKNFVLPKDLSELSFPFISKLIATCIWYFEESVSQTLLDSEDDLILSIVENESDFIYFFKSSTTGKCYFSYDEKTNKKSCSLQEYEDAIQKGEISERIERGALN